jgi:hypothetical protein
MEAKPEEAPLKITVSMRRDPVTLLKYLGMSALGIASVPAILWVRPSLTDQWGNGYANAALRVPNFTNLLLYASILLLGLLGVVLLFVVLLGVLRGILMGTCPACGAKVLPGGNLETECPECKRKLEVVRLEAAAPTERT